MALIVSAATAGSAAQAGADRAAQAGAGRAAQAAQAAQSEAADGAMNSDSFSLPYSLAGMAGRTESWTNQTNSN